MFCFAKEKKFQQRRFTFDLVFSGVVKTIYKMEKWNVSGVKATAKQIATVNNLLLLLIFWDLSNNGRTNDFPVGENSTSSTRTVNTILVISIAREIPNK